MARWVGVQRLWEDVRGSVGRCAEAVGGFMCVAVGGCAWMCVAMLRYRRIPNGWEAVPPAALAAGTARADVGGGGWHCREEESAAGGAGRQRLYLQQPKAKTTPNKNLKIYSFFVARQ